MLIEHVELVGIEHLDLDQMMLIEHFKLIGIEHLNLDQMMLHVD
jgi:hypothetical protein